MPDANTEYPQHPALLILPRIRIQNANAISSPMTWGFPAITAFTGLMTALERQLGADAGIALLGIGVICHHFEAQISSGGYTRAFHLTRNPVKKDGATAAIVEEGRAHLEVSLVFDVRLAGAQTDDMARTALAKRAAHLLAGMRIAGGSVMPPLHERSRHMPAATLVLLERDEQKAQQQFRRLARHWLPGFALVSRDDLLRDRLRQLQSASPQATVLDAWLDLSRWTHRSATAPDEAKPDDKVEWMTETRSGWTVPIPVGFTALSDLQAPGAVRDARDMSTPFRFVETIWSMGQWISPHRLRNIAALAWYPFHDASAPTGSGLYRCQNDYISTQSQTTSSI